MSPVLKTPRYKMIRRNTRAMLALAVAGALALGCGGRSVAGQDDGTDRDVVDTDGRDTGRDTKVDGVTTDTKTDGTQTDGVVGDTGPVANAIAPIQQSDVSVQCPPAGSTETPAFGNGATGLVIDAVVVSPRWVVSKDSTTGEPKLYGYIVMDAGLPTAEAWRGIAITVTPDLNPTAWAIGDVLSLTGDHQEYYCFTQFKVTAVTPMGTGVVPQPVEIDPADLGSQDPTTAEKYEGVLVTVKNVEVTETPHNGSDSKDHGAFKITGGLIVANDFHVAYMSTGSDDRTLGDKFDSITGVVKFSYGEYIVTPRFDSDVVLEGQTPPEGSDIPTPQDVIENDLPDGVTPGGTTLASLQSAAASTGCTAQSIQNIQAGVTFAPVVVVAPKFVASSGKLDGYFIADAGQATAAEWAGVQMTVDVALATAFVPGDVLTLTGDVLEYYCLTEVKATAVAKSGSAAVPAPRVVSAASLAAQAAAGWEPVEGVLVELDDVTVTSANPDEGAGKDYGSFAVGDNIIVSNSFKLNYMNTATDQRKVGDAFDKIVGVVTYSFGKYAVLPRTNDDLVLAGTTPVEPTPDVIEPADVVVTDTATDTTTPPVSLTVKQLQGGTDSQACSGGVANGTPKYGIALGPVVVTTPKYSASATFDGYYVADAAATGDDTGLVVVVAKSLNTAFAVGDVLDIKGDYKEYFCMSEVVVAATATAPNTVGSIAKTGTATPPAAAAIAASVLENGGAAATAEAYESRIVTLPALKVTAITSPDGKAWFQVGTAIEVGTDFFYPASTQPYTPVLDNTVTLTGALKYHFGKYRVEPRTAADIVVTP
jgi:hypothetical protein